jgi:hypothetical protein
MLPFDRHGKPEINLDWRFGFGRYSISAFAPWVYLKDKREVKGAFSLPPLRDRKVYEAMKANDGKARLDGALHW